MKNAKKLKGAKEQFGINVTVNKLLDKNAKKSLFPDKLNKVNAVLSTLK